jgi:hypothetical protein
MEKEIPKRICPNIESEGFKELIMVRKTHSNKKDRVRFSILFQLCEDKPFCRSKEDINIFLTETYWNLFNVVN